MKILSVFGTRPEAIKMAVLCQKLNKEPLIEHKICITGQHKEMLDQVLDFFEIKPDFDLAVMKPGQDLTDVTSKVLKGLRDLFGYYKPNLLLVHGDTTTSMAAALAGFYAGVKVGHVEAGLRTGNLLSPFPEEANRNITSKLAEFHFAPTQSNKENLENEGLQKNIFVTGNTVIDALLYTSRKVNGFSDKITDFSLKTMFRNNKILLVTGHRRENFGDGFLNICKALQEIALLYPDLQIVYPVHLNPQVQKPVKKILSNISNVHLIDPLDYPDFVYAMKMSWVILTDSGGVQEEAPSLGKPVLVMRDTTERPEALEAGTVKLVGTETQNIVSIITDLMKDHDLYKKMCAAHNPYGDGKAAVNILTILLQTH